MEVPMPRDLSEEAVAEWLYGLAPTCARVPVSNDPAMTWAECVEECPGFIEHFRIKARAVRALVEATGEKVARQAYHAGYSACVAGIDVTTRIDADVYFILARVLGDHPKGGHEAEGREAPRA